jgi:hypothetical protein
MSTALSLAEAARRSGLDLDVIMKAIRSGELGASREMQGGYMVTERDLGRFLNRKSNPRLSDILAAEQPPIPQLIPANAETTADALSRVREAFGSVPPEPDPQPGPVAPSVPPARDLGQWSESYLDGSRKVDWYLRKLEADADWLNQQLARGIGPETDLSEDAASCETRSGRSSSSDDPIG